MNSELGIYIASGVLAIVIITSVILAPNSGMTGFTVYQTPPDAEVPENEVNIYKSSGFPLGICLKEIGVNSTSNTTVGLVRSEEGFDNETVSEEIIFAVSESIFRNYTGVDIVLYTVDLDNRELEVIVNGKTSIILNSRENHTGMRIVTVNKDDLVLGENSVRFVNKKDDRCGLVLNGIDIRASLRNTGMYDSDKNIYTESGYSFEYKENITITQCPQEENVSETVYFNLKNFSFYNHSGIEMIFYIEQDLDLNEIKIFVNNQSVGWLNPPRMNYEGVVKLSVPDSILLTGSNSLRIENPLGGGCGVKINSIRMRNMLDESKISGKSGILHAERNLMIGNCSEKTYEDGYSATFTVGSEFQKITGVDVILDLKHLYPEEITVVMNGENLGYIESVNDFRGKKFLFVPKKNLISGANTLFLAMDSSKKKNHCLYVSSLKVQLSYKNNTAGNVLGIEASAREKSDVLFSASKIYAADKNPGEEFSVNISFDLPFEVFKKISGVDLISREVVNIRKNELKLSVNGAVLGWISCPFEDKMYTGAKKIHVPDVYLTAGENILTFFRPSNVTTQGAIFNDVEILPDY